jgi:hypothetical protein
MLHVLAALLMLADTPPPDANAIMRRMAAALESSLEARRQYVYRQRVRAKLVRANGQTARAERREYTVTPGPQRTEKTLLSLAGEYHKSRKEIIRYDNPGFEKGGMDIDGGVMEFLIDDLVVDKDSRDGIPDNLFPMRAKDLNAYRFTYLGSTEVKGRKAHRVAFEPVSKKTRCPGSDSDDDCDSRPWKGEAVIDAEEHQPVRIFTDLAFKMPWGVKVFLGTNLRQTGFSISYARVAPNVWFPATYGSEFRLDVLFGYKRVITLALDSSEFQKTEAKSEIRFDAVADK